MTSKITCLERSKDNWKNKAGLRADEARQLRKDKKRSQHTINMLRQMNIKLKADIKNFQRINTTQQAELIRMKNDLDYLQSLPSDCADNITQLNFYTQMRTLCVMLVVVGALSFRSIPRVFDIFSKSKWIQSCHLPHFTSIINWTLRSGISIYENVTTLEKPWFCIIDCSIDIGVRKALVVLRVPLSVVQHKNGAIGLNDCECIGIKVATSWNGISVESELNDIFNKAGRPIAIIKDQGSDLSKGVRLYCENNHAEVLAVDDIGHFAANALCEEFSQKDEFKNFMELVNIGSAKIRQTEFAYLLPPKISSKGRFQGITKLAKWSEKILNLLKVKNRNYSNPSSKLWQCFSGLLRLKDFLIYFAKTSAIVENFLELLKNNGLNRSTFVKAKKLLKNLPKESIVRNRFDQWLTKHLEIYNLLGMAGGQKLLVSSDVIESLFGHFKAIVQRSPKAELNRLVYVLPLLCGSRSSEQLDQAIRECSHQEMLRHIADKIPPTLRQQRYEAFASMSGGQKIGKYLANGTQ